MLFCSEISLRSVKSSDDALLDDNYFKASPR